MVVPSVTALDYIRFGGASSAVWVPPWQPETKRSCGAKEKKHENRHLQNNTACLQRTKQGGGKTHTLEDTRFMSNNRYAGNLMHDIGLAQS